MSKLIGLLVLVALGAGGYYVWKLIPTTPKSETFGGYMQGLHNDASKTQSAASTANVIAVQQAVNTYKVDKGTLPNTLEDLVPDYLDHIPGGMQYDASTGTVAPAP